MREIIFRGKRTDNGEWVEGYITRRPSAIQFEAHYSPWFIDKPPSDPDDSGGFYNVYRGTIGQFTGLEDKNGNRIFEGDIVKIDEEVKEMFNLNDGAIYFNGGCFFVSNNGGGILSALHSIADINYIFRGEVIGNIHDNPELLNTNEEREAEE